MKFAGQNDPNVFFGSYMPQISTVDGISNYWGLRRRVVHLEGLRGRSLHYHPQLLQSLPAKVQDDLTHRANFVALNKEIEALGQELAELVEKGDSQTVRARREELYRQKRQLVSEELSRWQEMQPHNITSEAEYERSPVVALPSFFNRIRRLDPPRNRLASTLFLNVPLHSDQGQSVLRDMITLYKENPQVAYRPSL
jgi:hypothetical protein